MQTHLVSIHIWRSSSFTSSSDYLICNLFRRSLKTYKCSHRLLLTGTPLQNNLAELWSLLNFLLPEIFDDLGSFEMWFDLDYLQSGSSVDDEIIAEEKQHNILAMLHQILTPFMLRRLKRDVDLDVPPKREVLVYAPLSSKQKDLYLASLDLTIRALVGLEKVGIMTSAVIVNIQNGQYCCTSFS